MVERRKFEPRRVGGDYFPDAAKKLKFIPSGCTLLDCVLGGGWPLGRISNIVGDKSAGKTLLAIEACANFARRYPKGKIWYRESEAAFDEEYAAKLGLPLNRVNFGPDGLDTQWDTVEDVFEDLEHVVAQAEKSGEPGLYIVDSLDALTDRAERETKIDQGSYGTAKAKLLSRLFRTHVRPIKKTNIHGMFISQIRDKIGVTFGEKKTRTGGHAMDFYASHILWLAHLKTLVRTIGGEKRPTGIKVLANCKKNKIGTPFLRCEFPIRFGYGMDDVEASFDWLTAQKMVTRLGIEQTPKAINNYLDELSEMSSGEYAKRAEQIRATVMQAWHEVATKFAPERSKYG